MRHRFEFDPEHASRFRIAGLSDLDAVFRFDAGERLDKPGLEPWRQRWRVHLDPAERGARVCYLKRFERPPLRRQWSRWRAGHFTRSTAEIEYRNARALAEAGIPAAKAIGFGHEMRGPLEVRSFVLLDAVAGDALERCLPGHWSSGGGGGLQARRRRGLDALARLVASFHRHGFVHRDLYLSHVFYDAGGGGGPVQADPGQLALIDLQRVFKPRWRARRWVVKDLAALDASSPGQLVSRGDRLRFLARYVRVCARFGSARELARLIEARNRRMRRGRRGG